MTTVAFKTLGCKLNQYETEAMRAGVEGAGFRTVSFDEAAACYVINTCTVTHRSDYKSRQLVRRVCRERPKVLAIRVVFARHKKPEDQIDEDPGERCADHRDEDV